MKCPKCGTEYQGKFCPKCNLSVKKPSKNGKSFKIAASIIGGILVLSLVSSIFGQSESTDTLLSVSSNISSTMPFSSSLSAKESSSTPVIEYTTPPQTQQESSAASVEPTPEPVTEPQPEPRHEPQQTTMVWISRSGKKYHSNPNCSGMKSPSQVSIEQAQSSGYTPCKKCYS